MSGCRWHEIPGGASNKEKCSLASQTAGQGEAGFKIKDGNEQITGNRRVSRQGEDD
jgi:hypothetical protein